MSLTHHPLLGRRPVRAGPDIALVPEKNEFRLTCGRVHEACGMARRTFALWLAAQTTGPILWITPTWNRDRLNPEGMVEWVDPGRFIFVNAIRAEDVLWSLEEALRAGAVPLVVGDLPGLPSLTQVRRMHLAAETGGKDGPYVPLGLLLTPDQGGAQGVESRWHMTSDHANTPGSWHLQRLRARTAPQAQWRLQIPNARGSLQIKAA